MPVTKDQAAALAQFAVACRPHGAPQWDAAGVTAAIAKVKQLALADVALAVFRAADDRSCQTPGVIGNTRSPCWSERATRPLTHEPFDRDGFCDICGKPHGRHPEGDHEFMSVTEQTRAIAADEERAEVAAEALEYARQAVGDAKAAGITPPPEREHKPSADVEALRTEVAAAEVTG